MNEPIVIDIEEGIAAVKLKGNWRFFYDNDWMFLLDWSAYKYRPGERPDTHDLRRNTLVVDENNAEAWMRLLTGELTADQIPHAVYEDGVQARLIFVIDFDQKLWIGCMWHMDQSALDEYQPAGWTAGEDDVFKYVPEEIARLWDGQLITDDVFLVVDSTPHTLISARTRPVVWDEMRMPLDTRKTEFLRVEFRQGRMQFIAVTLDNLPGDQQFDLCFRYIVGYGKELTVEVGRCPLGPGYTSETFAKLGPFALT